MYLVRPLTPEARKEVFEIVEYLDRQLRAKAFSEVDSFLINTDAAAITNAAYLLAILNYIRMAEERQHILVEPSERATRRLRQLVGDDRADKLLRNR